MGAESLRSYVERLERLADAIADIRADVRDVRAEAKEDGFCLKALDMLLRRRRMEPALREELDGLLEAYEAVVGLPGVDGRVVIDGGTLGQAALPAPPPKLSAKARELREALGWASGEGVH